MGISFMDKFGLGILPRIRLEETILICQQQQGVSFNQVGHQRCQGVIVTKANLISDDCIVFVNHRDDPQFQQTAQGAAGINITFSRAQIVVGQQNLRSVQVVALELGFISLDKAHLAYRCGCLEQMQGLGASCNAKPLHALRNGTGGHQHNLHPGAIDLNNIIYPGTHLLDVQSLTVGCQQ